MKLYTLGYEGMTVDEYFQILHENGIAVLADVRDLPISRKKGFSKAALAEKCGQKSILYVHFKDLGCPKEIRHAYRKDKDWEVFQQKYVPYLQTKSQAIDELISTASFNTVCLLCFEADPAGCHRSLICEEILTRHAISDHASAIRLGCRGMILPCCEITV